MGVEEREGKIMSRHKLETAWIEVGEIGVDAGLCWVGSGSVH